MRHAFRSTQCNLDIIRGSIMSEVGNTLNNEVIRMVSKWADDDRVKQILSTGFNGMEYVLELDYVYGLNNTASQVIFYIGNGMLSSAIVNSRVILDVSSVLGTSCGCVRLTTTNDTTMIDIMHIMTKVSPIVTSYTLISNDTIQVNFTEVSINRIFNLLASIKSSFQRGAYISENSNWG